MLCNYFYDFPELRSTFWRGSVVDLLACTKCAIERQWFVEIDTYSKCMPVHFIMHFATYTARLAGCVDLHRIYTANSEDLKTEVKYGWRVVEPSSELTTGIVLTSTNVTKWRSLFCCVGLESWKRVEEVFCRELIFYFLAACQGVCQLSKSRKSIFTACESDFVLTSPVVQWIESSVQCKPNTKTIFAQYANLILRSAIESKKHCGRTK